MSGGSDPHRGGRKADDGRDRGGPSRLVLASFGLVGQLGLTVVAGSLLGALAGYGLDRLLGTAPGFLVAGLIVGLAGGGVGAYRLIARYLE